MKQLHQVERYRDIPIIIITADDNARQQEEAISLGASDYIVKPFVVNVVIKRVKNVLGLRRRYLELFHQIQNAGDKIGPKQEDK